MKIESCLDSDKENRMEEGRNYHSKLLAVVSAVSREPFHWAHV